MLRSLPLFIGLRYTRAKRRNHFLSFISASSMLGIALGVTVLITVLSVMNGLERAQRERILGVTPHVVVGAASGELGSWPALQAKLAQQPGVVGTAPFIGFQAIMNVGQLNEFATVMGVSPEQEGQVSVLPSHMRFGDFEALKTTRFGIVLGDILARSLGVTVGDKVSVITPEGSTLSIAGATPSVKRFTVVGTFKVGAEMDARLAITHIRDAGRLVKIPSEEVSGLRLKLADLFAAGAMTGRLRELLGPDYAVKDWTETHGALFAAIAMEKRMMFVLLMLVVAVAAFNIISTLVMAVSDKRSDIAILRTLGASPRTIMGVFMVQGSYNGLVGSLIGLVAGVSLALNVGEVVAYVEQLFGFYVLPPEVYFVSSLPSELHAEDVWQIALMSLALSFLATVYPAWRASTIQPAEALRYE